MALPQTQRSSLKKLMNQMQLNRFYSHPVAQVSMGLTLTILAVIFFAMVAIRPTLETMAELIRQIDDKKTVDQKLSLKISALSTAQAELAAKQNDAQVLDVAIPSTPDFTLLLKEIEKLISENNVTFVSLIAQSVPVERDTSTVTTTDLQSLPFTLTVNGTYPNVLATIQELSNLQRLLIIDRVDILPPSDQDTQSLNMSISFRAFAFGSSALHKKTPGPGGV